MPVILIVAATPQLQTSLITHVDVQRTELIAGHRRPAYQGTDLAIFTGIWTHSSCRLRLKA